MAVAGLRWPQKQATRKCRLFCLGERQEALALPVRRRGWPLGPEAGLIRPPPLLATGLAAAASVFRPRLPFFALGGPASLTTPRRGRRATLAPMPAFHALSSCLET